MRETTLLHDFENDKEENPLFISDKYLRTQLQKLSLVPDLSGTMSPQRHAANPSHQNPTSHSANIGSGLLPAS